MECGPLSRHAHVKNREPRFLHCCIPFRAMSEVWTKMSG